MSDTHKYPENVTRAFQSIRSEMSASVGLLLWLWLLLWVVVLLAAIHNSRGPARRATTSAITRQSDGRPGPVTYAETLSLYSATGSGTCETPGYVCGAEVVITVGGFGGLGGTSRSGFSNGPRGTVTLDGLPKGHGYYTIRRGVLDCGLYGIDVPSGYTSTTIVMGDC